MADSAAEEDTELWLPSEFLTDYHILMDKQILNNNRLRNGLTSNLRLPTEFPFDFTSLGSYSAFNSLGSTKTEGHEEESLVGLTRSSLLETLEPVSIPHNKLEKYLAFSGPSQFSSSATTLLRVGNGDPGDLVTQPAGQVARLEINGDDRGAFRSGAVVDPSNSLGARVQPLHPLKNLNSGSYSNRSIIDNFRQVKQQQILMQQMREVLVNRAKDEWYFQNQLAHCRSGSTVGVGFGGAGFGRPVGLPQPAWTAPEVQNYCPHGNNQDHHHHHNSTLRHGSSVMRTVPFSVSGGGGGGLKKERPGTGVFLPRRYTNPLESNKKTGCSTATFPAKIVQTRNQNYQDMNAHVQHLHQPRLNVPWVPDYAMLHSDLMMAGSNILLNHHKPVARPDAEITREICLPQDWTY